MPPPRLPRVADLTETTNGIGFFLCARKEVRQTKTGEPFLALAGALAGFVAYLYALRHLPVSFVSLYAYVNPVIAVALGTLLLGEPFHLRMAAGAVAVLAGMAVVSAARSRPGPASLRSDDGG